MPPVHLHCMKMKSLNFLPNFCVSLIFQNTCKHDSGVFCYLHLLFLYSPLSGLLNYKADFPLMRPLCSALSPLTCFPWGRAECSMAECIGFYGDHHLTGPGAVSQQVILEWESCCLFHVKRGSHTPQGIVGNDIFHHVPHCYGISKGFGS